MRVGLFGTGHWARITQGAALAAHPQVDLVGIWGRDPDRTAALATSLACRPFADADELIAAVDTVAIALPPDVQAGLAVRAAEAGRHLLLDKPLALDAAEAQAVVDAVQAAGVASVVFFTGRFTRPVQEFLLAARDEQWFGGRAVLFGSIFETPSPYGASPWRRAKGGLWDVGPHALAVLLPVLGPVRDVAAMTGPRATSHVLLGHTSAAVSQLTLTVDAPPGAVGFRTELSGPDGFVEVPQAGVPGAEAFAVAIDELRDLVAAGRTDHACDVRFGRDVVTILARAEADAQARVHGGDV